MPKYNYLKEGVERLGGGESEIKILTSQINNAYA